MNPPLKFGAVLLLVLCIIHASLCSTNANIPLTNNPYHYQHSSHKHSFGSTDIISLLQSKWSTAQSLALQEQSVEDHNAEYVATSNSVDSVCYRRCIVLPLDERFDPPVGVFSHGHIETGDKMSLPKCFWDAITRSKAEVPWLFEVSRVDGVTAPRVELPHDEHHHASASSLAKVVGGALDFRSPDNYAFLPAWMMKALGLRPRDVVDIRLVTTTPPGSAVRLRPHTSAFVNIGNHQAVLETELKHYSALTLGSTIPFHYRGETFYFDVVDLRSAPRGEKVATAKVQDCDIAAEFVRPKDQLKPKKKKQKSSDK